MMLTVYYDRLSSITFFIGFPRSQTVSLINQSQVPVAFALKVPGDGEMSPVSWDMFAAAISKPALPQYCQEFTLSPDTGVIDANSSVAVEVRSSEQPVFCLRSDTRTSSGSWKLAKNHTSTTKFFNSF